MAAQGKPWYRARNIVLALAVVILAPVAWAIIEVLRVYLGEPAVSRDYRAEFRALSEKAAGVPAGSGDEAWAILVDAATRCTDIVTQHTKRIRDGELPARSLPGEGREAPSIDFGLVLEGRALAQGVQRELDVIKALREHGIFERLSEFAAKAPGFRDGDRTQQMVSELLPEYGPMRDLAQARVASMRLALLEHDHGEVARAFHDLVCMGQTISHQPGIVSPLVATSISRVTNSELRQELAEGEFDAATCRAMLDSMERHPMADAALALKGEQACFHDMLQWLCVDVGDGYMNNDVLETVSGGRLGAPRQSLWGATLGRFVLPSRRETARVYDQFIESCLKEVALPAAQRWQGSFKPKQFDAQLSPRHTVIKLVIPAIDKSLAAYALGLQDRHATRVSIALELWHALHGRWPSSLEELAPEILPQPPRDPLHGGPFGYRLLQDDPHGRPYLLYSFGIDQTDDGGGMQHGADSSDSELKSEHYKVLADHQFSGLDFVFNRPRTPSQLQPNAVRDAPASDQEADGF